MAISNQIVIVLFDVEWLSIIIFKGVKHLLIIFFLAFQKKKKLLGYKLIFAKVKYVDLVKAFGEYLHVPSAYTYSLLLRKSHRDESVANK